MNRRRTVLKLETLEPRCVPTTVTNLNDSGPGSLREAIDITPAGGTVDFMRGLTGTITLTSGQLLLTKMVTINGPGSDTLVVSGGGNSRVVFVATTATISDVTIAEGQSAESGAGVYNAGVLTISDCVIRDNSMAGGALDGGAGIFNAGILTVTGSMVANNRSSGLTSIYGGRRNP